MCNCTCSRYTFQHCSAQRTIIVQYIHGVSLVTMFSIVHLLMISGVYMAWYVLFVHVVCLYFLLVVLDCPSPCLSLCKKLCSFLTLLSIETIPLTLSHSTSSPQVDFLFSTCLRTSYISHLLFCREDPRLHSCIVCASISCPNVAMTAFTPWNLNEQMTNQMRDFLSNSKKGSTHIHCVHVCMCMWCVIACVVCAQVLSAMCCMYLHV